MYRQKEQELERNTTCWNKVEKFLQYPEKIKQEPRRGWSTIRIFVSSTFKDFHYERDVLVKKVFPDLRKWCQTRKLHLVECDLRWGAPPHFHSQDTLEMCLGEIDRCHKENKLPFFINMTSQRIGWIPKPNEPLEKDRILQETLDNYKLVFGFSITEMEIFHGAYRIKNPNAMFLMREDSFFKTLPVDDREDSKKALEDFKYDGFSEQKLKILREKLHNRFQVSDEQPCIIKYKALFKDFNEEGKVVLDIIDEDSIMNMITEFFKVRIDRMYPKPEAVTDKFTDRQLAHEAFMQFKDHNIHGRDDILKKISQYVHTDASDVPLLVLGGPGTGKSSIMARAAHSAQTFRDKAVHVFYHFVGAVPGSTEPLIMLQRLIKEITTLQENELPSDIESAIQLTYSTLTHPQCKPVIIFIDALNQFDDDKQLVPLMNWVPRKLTENVKCVFSLIQASSGTSRSHYNVLTSRESKPIEILVKDLDEEDRKTIVTNFFELWTKKLDEDQMKALMKKECSKNPLWLTVACEELRVHGNFRTMKSLDKIEKLQDDLLKLIVQVLERFEKESKESESLLIATLCLIEVSKRGLLESELYYVLGDDEILPVETGKGKEYEKGESEKKEKCRFTDEDRLPAYSWNMITRALGPFLRPFGDLGEGRLDFYHRAVSKAVRHKYLGAKNEPSKSRDHWHSKLADYFELCEHAKAADALERRVEEYPHHLVQLKDEKRLQEFLDDWKSFDKLYDRDHSLTLLHYWDKCGGKQRMAQCYVEKLKGLSDTSDILQRYEEIGRVMLQYGLYDRALELAQTGLVVAENDQIGAPKPRLAAYYTLLSDIYDAKYKQADEVSADNIPVVQDALKYSNKSIHILKELSQQNDFQKKLYGKYLCRHAMNHCSLADSLAEYYDGPVEQATEEGYTPESVRLKGQEYIDEAITLFQQMQEKGLLAEAIKTKGSLNRETFNVQIKLLKEAKEMCKEAYGDSHILMARILNNMGIAHADDGDYKAALEYYIQSYEVYWEIYGNDHPITKSAFNITQDQFYVKRFKKYNGKN